MHDKINCIKNKIPFDVQYVVHTCIEEMQTLQW